MPKLSNLNVWMEAGGAPLEEYGVQVKNSGDNVKAICWVACETGTEFKLGVSRQGSVQRNYVFSVSVDGTVIHPLSGRPVLRSHERCDPEHPRYYEGLQEQGTVRPFQFAALTLTDDDQYLSLPNRYLGEIAVTIFSYVDIADGPGPKFTSTSDFRREAESLMGETIIHEKTKKGLKTCVKLGERKATATDASGGNITPSTRGAKRPRHFVGHKLIGEVIFKYRDMGTLIADGVAPRPQGQGLGLPATTSTVSNSQAIDNPSTALEGELDKLKVGIRSLRASEVRSRKMNKALVAITMFLLLSFYLLFWFGYIVKA